MLLTDLRRTSPAHAAVLASAGGRGASGFLTCLPCDSALKMDSDSFSTALRLRLRAPAFGRAGSVALASRCSCGAAIDEFGDHLLVCTSSSGLKVERHHSIRDYAIGELKRVHASVRREMACRDVPGRSSEAQALLDDHEAEARREAAERRARGGTGARAGGSGGAASSGSGSGDSRGGRLPGVIVPCDGIVLDHCTAGGRAAGGAAHLAFDTVVSTVVAGDHIDDAARGGTNTVADKEEIKKCVGSIKQSEGRIGAMILDLLAPSTLLVPAALEHIGALGAGAYDLFGKFIPQGLARCGASPLPLACPEDPEELMKVLLQSEKQRVLQRVSVVLQRGNARLIGLRADRAAPSRPCTGPSSSGRRRARANALVRARGGFSGA